MPHFYLTTWEEPEPGVFWPLGIAGQPWWMVLDIRPDAMAVGGFAFLAVRNRLDFPGGNYLGEDLTAESNQLRALLQSKLNVPVQARRLDLALHELLTEHAGPGKWRPARPESDGQVHIYLYREIQGPPPGEGG